MDEQTVAAGDRAAEPGDADAGLHPRPLPHLCLLRRPHRRHVPTTFMAALEKVVVVHFPVTHHKATATSMSIDLSAIVQCLFRLLITAIYPSQLVQIYCRCKENITHFQIIIYLY
jgi:hypothetical protein